MECRRNKSELATWLAFAIGLAFAAAAVSCADARDESVAVEETPGSEAPPPSADERANAAAEPTSEATTSGTEASSQGAAPPSSPSAKSAVPGSPPMPSVDVHPDVDLPGAADDRVWLGMNVRDARPRLTDACVSDHYAERLAPYYLRLSCLTAPDAALAETRRIRFGVLEGEHGTDEPTRLAYHIETLEVGASDLDRIFGALRDDAERRHGPPSLVTAASAGVADGTRLSWRGVGRGDRPTTMELAVTSLTGGRFEIASAYRDVELSNALFDAR